ncbi:carbonic anhydrase [Bifidobacterium adolescentis]|uniref:carbonic anhydrase n=1 Tax=Bifidobacterium adolescentis TaxID=1680 RepID=UPI000E44CA9B|nr:carbonic anhydrase [Bifidobacterium adolescentis]RGL56077.1 carbonic anhydrase [Bifidobacterium adolescentis]RGL56877.1 carbonic anhydrase [Bifidobacterium adolescentis]RGL64922.1 carbonic anhydrase [Bifidobacterium adolescentis]
MTDETFVNQNDVEGTANGVWSRMLAGNRRFTEDKLEHPNRSVEAREATIDTHEPDAAVLSCSDARVSPDIIFDAGIGDLFTVRTAGQVIDDAVIASLEYAVDVLGVRLLVVLGHQNCGAIKQACREYEALLHELTADAEDSLMAADSVADLDERIMNAESLMLRTVGFSIWQAHESELESAEDFERVHIARTIEQLVERSEVIQRALAEDRLMITGARYQLDTGKVEVLSF